MSVLPFLEVVISFFRDYHLIACGTVLIVFPVFIFLFVKGFIKLLLFVYYINFWIANFFSLPKKQSVTKNNDNQNHLPNILINNKDLDSNCLINLKLIEMMERKNHHNSQTDLLEMKQKMLETYFNQKIFEIEIKQKIKDLEEQQKQTTISQPKDFLDEIPKTLRQILEKLSNVEEMQFEILQDSTKKTHYNFDNKILYVHPEDFLHINKALVQQKNKQLKN
ncbi:hypothetical protein [Candidatus Phytoplasma solani]|uniref:Uncharacterized protein n=2 Tax=Candidatus Phytoplasma solani TaxID=69896 RepID=A0A421NXL9_9MOLU|nr:hypothetical protein [Candidatus Phytoplasma solani]RMI88670.1 hypothetical protein PSSA1_v1c3990 [Candidatus Phytoplasma solani]